jgi:hypothetical protein
MKLDFDFGQACPDGKEHSGDLSSTSQTAVSEKSNSPSAGRHQYCQNKLMNIRVGRRSLNHEKTECRVEPANEMIIAS